MLFPAFTCAMCLHLGAFSFGNSTDVSFSRKFIRNGLMIARFFPCFKGAFGKISTIFLAHQLSNKKPEKKRQSGDKNQRQKWRNRRSPAGNRGLCPFSLPSGSMEKTSSNMPISIESEKTTQRNHFRSGKKSDILDKTQFLCIIKLLHHPFHRPPRR